MRFSIHIDAGYLYAALATRETGSSNRAAVVVDEARLIGSLMDLAARDCGRPPLRVLWYDAGHNGLPSRDQQRIGMIDGVKLRMGRVNPYGEQKGVDLRLGLDLVSYGVNRAVDVAYLVSGDDDITEAVADAQDLGIQVKLISVPTADGQRPLSVAQNLLLAADGMMTIPSEIIDRAVHRAGAPSAVQAGNGAAPIGGSAAAVSSQRDPVVPPKHPSAGSPSPASPATGAPAPSAATPTNPVSKPSAAPMPAAPRPDPSPLAPYERAPLTPPRPTPAYSTSTGEAPHDYLTIIDPDDIEAVASNVFEVWATTATDEEKNDLLRSKPAIPQRIDRILLTDLVTRTGVDDIPVDARYGLRKEFWRVATASGIGPRSE